MAKKKINEFAKSYKYFNSCDTLYLQRDEADFYYITEGHAILKLDKYSYEMSFASKSTRFPVLEPDTKATSRKKSLPEINNGPDIKSFMTNYRPEREAVRTGMMTDMPGDNTGRIYLTKQITVVNNEFDKMAADAFTHLSHAIYGTDYRSPVVWTTAEGDRIFFILPIAYSAELIEQIKKIADYPTK